MNIRILGRQRICISLTFVWVSLAQFCVGQTPLFQLTTRNGMRFEGKFSSIPEISRDLTVRNPQAGGVAVKPIVIVDDELRRTYFPKRNLLSTNNASETNVIKIKQRSSSARKRVGSLGSVLGATPFDEFGRRTITVMANGGRQQVAQEIIEISPVYTRLQSPKFNWDMRIATSSIPSGQLKRILLQHRGNTPDTRLDLVRLLFMSERYKQAATELKAIIADFPELEKESLERQYQTLIQQYADLLLQEVARRRNAGQHRYVRFLLNGFDSTGAATESLIQASEMLSEYDKYEQQAQKVLDELSPLVEQSEGDAPRQKMIQQLHAEIKADLNIANLPRMADFLNLVGGTGLTNDEQLSIAISGWLLGQGEVIRNLQVAASLLEVRNLVREYLRAMGENNRHIRKELLARISDREGGTPEYVAKLLANMKPPLDMPAETNTPGLHNVEVPGMPDGFPVKYTVQLPPEYDPYVRYPVILSLHAAGGRPEGQVTWWAGEYSEKTKMRVGQATRHGYIVIAPAWTKKKQSTYEYSAREHHCVLASLRDAARRFSIDSDRVFISGHALGGDAAWDIAVSHPDLWAGMVLIGARGDYGDNAPQYVTFYDKNAKYFPLYFVFGELDGSKIHNNAIHLNRYMTKSGYDPVMVQYQGRGNEHFYEEVPRIFEWLELQQRKPAANKFEVDSMRPWDAFFWFVELEGFPQRTMVSPYSWPVKKPASSEIMGQILSRNGVRVRTGGATKATIWLSPDIVDFDKRIQLNVNGKSLRQDAIPSLETMLEDARQRADRQHVFWAKVVHAPG